MPTAPESPYRRTLAHGPHTPSDDARARAARIAGKLASLYLALGRPEDARRLYLRAQLLSKGTADEAEWSRLLHDL